jgi:thiamine biosynthesis lipoprotein
VRWRDRGWIDLGGIAKGYAVDCAIEAMRSFGIGWGIVNAGGDLRCFGKPQLIHIRDPNEPTTLLCLGALSDGAIATSAGYFSGVENGAHRIDALVDPQQHACTCWEGSISIVAPNGMAADALTKVVRLMPQSAPEILAHFNAQAILIDHEGGRTCGRRWMKGSAAV